MQTVTVKVELYRQRFKRRVVSKKKKVLFKQGGYLKRTMQRAMRYRKKASQPGKPPSAHRETGAPLRKLIAFFVDLASGSVICGPDVKPGNSGGYSPKPVPQLLDEGGDVRFETRFLPPKIVAMEGITTPTVTAHIAPRPFTRPTFSDGGENFEKLLREVPL